MTSFYFRLFIFFSLFFSAVQICIQIMLNIDDFLLITYTTYKYQHIIPPHINNLEIFVKSRRCHLFPYRNMGHAAVCIFFCVYLLYSNFLLRLFGYYKNITQNDIEVKEHRSLSWWRDFDILQHFWTNKKIIKNCIVIPAHVRSMTLGILAICMFDDAKISLENYPC